MKYDTPAICLQATCAFTLAGKPRVSSHVQKCKATKADHCIWFQLWRLDNRKDSEFATRYGYPKTAFKRESGTGYGYPKRFYRYFEDSDFFGKSCTLHNHSYCTRLPNLQAEVVLSGPRSIKFVSRLLKFLVFFYRLKYICHQNTPKLYLLFLLWAYHPKTCITNASKICQFF